MAGSGSASDAWRARRQFCLPIITPSLLQGKSMAVVSPMLPIFIHVDLGASLGSVGAVSSAYSLVQVCGSTLIGKVLARIHYRLAACLSLTVAIMSCVLCFESSNIVELVLARSLGALAVVAWDLSRKVWISVELPKQVRGRVMATMSGLNKFATLIAVGASGFLAQALSTRSIFLVQAALTTGALSTVCIHSCCSMSERNTPPCNRNDTRNNQLTSSQASLCTVFKAHWRTLATAGSFCACMNGCRIAWQIALPLEGHSLGLDKSGIGLLAGFCFVIEACVNLSITGYMMDRFGRKAVGVPALLLMASGFAAASFARSAPMIACAGAIYALGNGLSGGIVQTIAQDVIPSDARSQFLGLWKTVTTQGGLWMPAIFGIVSDVASLDQAVLTISVVTMMTAAWLVVFVNETAPARDESVPLGASVVSLQPAGDANASTSRTESSL